MKIKFSVVAFATICSLIAGLPLEAAYTIREGRLVDVDIAATLSPQEHFELGAEAMDRCNWGEAARQFRIVSTCFPASTYGQEALFYLGVCEFENSEYEDANFAFSEYLRVQNNPKFFLEAIEYKYQIAERFRCGARRRFLGSRKFPKWATAKTLALKIYDEVIAALPSHELAANALYSRGCLLWKLRDYRQSIDAFQLIIRRFPKSEIAPSCYINIGRIFVEQCRLEYQNPDLLALAEINFRRFQRDFPREERLCEVEALVSEMKEIYAEGLYDTGKFYEKVGKPMAAVIYYRNVINRFPETCIAERAKQHLERLLPPPPCIVEEEEEEEEECAAQAGSEEEPGEPESSEEA